MRMIVTVLVAMALTTMISMLWYISQPLIVSAANLSEDITETGSWNTSGSTQTFTLIRLGANVGYALAILFVWVWVFISAQAEDWRGEQVRYY